MKQTAVEWFNDEIIIHLNFDQRLYLKDIFKKALKMEKEQIMDSYLSGLIDPLIMKNYKGLSVDEIRIELKKQSAEYYNETYKNETK